MPLLALDVPLDLIVIGAAGALLYWAARVLFGQPLIWLVGEIPIVGGAAAGMVNKMLASVAGFAGGWLDAVAQPLSKLVAGPIGAIQGFAVSAIRGIEALASGQLTIGQVINSALGSLGDWIRSIAATAASAVAQVERIIPNLASLRLAVAALIAIGLPGAIAHTLAEARAFAVSQATAIASLLGQRIDAVEGELHAAETAAATAVASAEAVLGRRIEAGLGTLGADVATLGDLVAPLAAAGLLTLVPTLVRELEQIKNECVPSCKAITPQLPTLSLLGDLATLGLVGALVGEAIANPAAVGADVVSAVGDVEAAATGLFELFTGRAA